MASVKLYLDSACEGPVAWIGDYLATKTVTGNGVVSPANPEGTAYWAMTDMPADFYQAVSLSFSVTMNCFGWENDIADIAIGLSQNNPSTFRPPTPAITAVMDGTSLSLTEYNGTIDITLLQGWSLASWNGMKIAIVTNYATSMGSDAAGWSIDQLELTLEYTPLPGLNIISPAEAAELEYQTAIAELMGSAGTDFTFEVQTSLFPTFGEGAEVTLESNAEEKVSYSYWETDSFKSTGGWLTGVWLNLWKVGTPPSPFTVEVRVRTHTGTFADIGARPGSIIAYCARPWPEYDYGTSYATKTYFEFDAPVWVDVDVPLFLQLTSENSNNFNYIAVALTNSQQTPSTHISETAPGVFNTSAYGDSNVVYEFVQGSDLELLEDSSTSPNFTAAGFSDPFPADTQVDYAWPTLIPNEVHYWRVRISTPTAGVQPWLPVQTFTAVMLTKTVSLITNILASSLFKPFGLPADRFLQTAISALSKLDPVQATIDLGYVILLTPLEAATIVRPILLQWEPYFDSTLYQVQIATDNLFTAPLVDTIVDGYSYSATTLDCGTLYYWRVRAVA